MSIKGIIFDIDGTLGDTLPICVESYQLALERRLGRPFQKEEITRYFGRSEEGILAQYIQEDLPAAIDSYFELYEEMHQSLTEPFPGIIAVLDILRERKVPMAVVTGKGRRGAEISMRLLGLAPYVDIVETGFDAGPDKPESLRRALAALGLSPHQVVYVGDTPYDIEAANSTGMQAIGAAWAPTATVQNGAGSKALHVFRSVNDFRRWVEETF